MPSDSRGGNSAKKADNFKAPRWYHAERREFPRRQSPWNGRANHAPRFPELVAAGFRRSAAGFDLAETATGGENESGRKVRRKTECEYQRCESRRCESPPGRLDRLRRRWRLRQFQR